MECFEHKSKRKTPKRETKIKMGITAGRKEEHGKKLRRNCGKTEKM
jgi:hypothetical protein